MTRKRVGGFVFVTYAGDHGPRHVHIQYRGRWIGRWDLDHQRPLDDFAVSRHLRRALHKAGYLEAR